MNNHKIVCLDAATLYPATDRRWGMFAEYGDIEVYDRTLPEELAGRIAGADIVLTNKVVINADTIAACPQLKYIGVLATGYNIVDVDAAGKAGIAVCNVPAYSTASVAQTAIALLLAITNRVEHYACANRNGRWSECADFTYRDAEWAELAGKTFGVIGFGNTGRATAAIAAALGMKIAVATSKPQSELPEGYVKTDIDRLFKEADVVSLHCPLTAENRGLVDAGRLATMKPTAILINTARGPLVNEKALAKALAEGTIAAAGLDVLCDEPPHAECPLLSEPNCYITPHTAWASTEARKRLFDVALGNVAAFTAGNCTNKVN